MLDTHSFRGHLGDRELLGHLDLELAAHPDLVPDAPDLSPDCGVARCLRSTMETGSSGPSLESTVPARAESTVQAKVSLAGMRGSAAITDTVIVISSALRSKAHSRLVPGIAWASSIAHASSTAMRRSSISSRVKSSLAARPAVAVRRTERYAPSAGMHTCTWSCVVSRSACAARASLRPGTAVVAAVSSVTSLLRALLVGAHCKQPTARRS